MILLKKANGLLKCFHNDKNDNSRLLYLVFNVVLFILFVIQCSLIIYYNLNCISKGITFDSAVLLNQAMEINKQGTLILDGWKHYSSNGMDTPVPIAALFYSLTNNIFLSYGIANIILSFLLILSIIAILVQIRTSFISNIIILNLILIPYSAGMLGYIAMLFTHMAAYNIRILNVNLIIYVNLKLDTAKSMRKNLILIIFTFFISALNGFATGVFILICVVFPFLILHIFSIFVTDNIKLLFKARCIVNFIFAIAVMLGSYLSKLMWGREFTRVVSLTTIDQFFPNIDGYFIGMFRLFGAIPLLNVNALSVGGFVYVFKLLIVFVLLISLLFSIRSVVVKRDNHLIQQIAVSIFFTNALVLLLIYTRYGAKYFEDRYHLVPLMPLFFATAILLQKIIDMKKYIFKYSLLTIFLIVIGFLSIHEYDEYINAPTHFDTDKSIADVITKIRPDTVVVDADVTFGRTLRLLLPKAEVIVINEEFGYSDKNYDNYRLGQKAVYVSTKDSFEKLPEYISRNAQVIDSISDLNIYLLESIKFDFKNDMPDFGTVRDFPFTSGFGFGSGCSLDGDGILVSKGEQGIVLFGPYAKTQKGVYNFTLYYKIEEFQQEVGAAYFDIALNNGSVVINTVELNVHNEYITLQNIEIPDNATNIEYRISEAEGTIIKIVSIEITRIN